MSEARIEAWRARIDRGVDHVQRHPDGDLRLETLAALACFSPFHFHRIFKTVTGETLGGFIGRIRLEKAARRMMAQPGTALLTIALECGFESASGFSRAFRRRFGIAPSRWDRVTPLKERNLGKEAGHFPVYTVDELAAADGEGRFETAFFHYPRQRLAVIRVENAYSAFDRIRAAHDRLAAWYGEAVAPVTGMMLYGMSHDDPEITPLEQCRFDWAAVVPEAISVAAAGIRFREMPACTVAAVRARGDVQVLDRAWQYLWRFSLPRSGFEPIDLPAMEVYVTPPAVLGWATYDMWCAVPVQRSKET